MNTRSIAAIYAESEEHLLDHIAPMAEILQIPLIASEDADRELVQTYYPTVHFECGDPIEFRLKEFSERFDALINCKYWKPQLKTIFSHLYGKAPDLIFLPHGQSDKGFASPLLAPYAEQDIVLLYGDLLIAMLQSLNIEIPRFLMIGDFRRKYYEKYRNFYDNLAEEKIFSKLRKGRPTLLYAPTWMDADRSTSFFDWGASIASQLPADWNLIIKVHPLLELRSPSHYYSMMKHFENLPNALIVSSFPPVHAILSRVDAYLGDFSSVGYDFLYYRRPMLFIPNPNLPKARLHQCGHVLEEADPIFSWIENYPRSKNAEILQQRQEMLYRFAFSDIPEEHIGLNLRLRRGEQIQRSVHLGPLQPESLQVHRQILPASEGTLS